MRHLFLRFLAFLCRLVQTARFDNDQKYQLFSREKSTSASIEVSASQKFDDSDEPWSSFVIRIETFFQIMKILISTASYQTWTVLFQECISKDSLNCEIFRGGFFHSDQFHTWLQNSLSVNDIFFFGLELDLRYFSNVLYEYDTVTLKWQKSGEFFLQHQVVVGLTTKDFYFELFEVNSRPSNFINFDITFPSFMSSLKNKSMISFINYVYTAGNQYRPNKILASLTLGDYDSSRFILNEVGFPFHPIKDRDFTVTINSIIMTNLWPDT